ncbi:MAG TPA: mannosyltransferase family protein [Vicinamibacterales bacterium]
MNRALPAAPSATTARLPWWTTLLDAFTLVALALLVSNVALGGFRLRFGNVRITAENPLRTLVIVVVLAGVRHFLCRTPSLPARLGHWARRAWRAPERGRILPAFLLSRLMVLAVGFLGVVLVGYPEDAPPVRISRNELINLPLRWDAGWYLQIAHDGYSYRANAGPAAQQNVAFFPAYPMITRVVAAFLGTRAVTVGEQISGNRTEWRYAQHRRIVLAAMLVTLTAFGWALVYLFRLARDLLGGDDDAATGAVLMACLWPCSLFFSAMYTEALFLLACLGAWYHLRQGGHVAAGCWGLLAGLARPNGFLLAIPLAALVLLQWRAASRQDGGRTARLIAGLAAAATPGIGMLLFSAYLYSYTGRALVWMDAHQAWGRVATDVSGMLADRASFIAEQGLYQYSVSQPLEILNAVPTFAALALAIPIARRFGLPYALLVVVMVLPPLLRGGFLSLGRLTSTLFPLFLYLGWCLRGSTRAAVVAAFAGLQAFLALLFFTWRPFF